MLGESLRETVLMSRPTHCLWEGCEAVLNSWALLEKHIDHCHLRRLQSSASDATDVKPIICCWDRCAASHGSIQACHEHCLTDHMGAYSARCPFSECASYPAWSISSKGDCLYEGPNFAALLAHIDRRHPLATPDDFVPGLIHHRPSYLPESISDLPQLPHLLILSSTDDVHTSAFLSGDVPGFTGDIAVKTQNCVARRCMSGHRPRKDDFADKQGASAAISAAIENSRRISVAFHSINSGIEMDKQDGNVSELIPSMPVSASEAEEQGVQIIDIKLSARRAREHAKAAILRCSSPGSTSESAGSRSNSRTKLTSPSSDVRSSHTSLVSRPLRRQTENDSESESEASESNASDESLYDSRRSPRQSPRISGTPRGESALKRSERLRRKTGGGTSGPAREFKEEVIDP